MSRHNLLKASLAKFVMLSDEEFETFTDALSFKKFKKGENLHQAGKICDMAFFIQQGCVRYYNIVGDEEITGQFFFEESWYSDYESFLLNVASDQTIQALETTHVAILYKHTLDKLYVEIPKFERFGRLMAENAFIGLRRRTESLTHQAATERYVELVQDRPKVIQRVPQKYIASFLNVKPQSLSRIRKELAEK